MALVTFFPKKKKRTQASSVPFPAKENSLPRLQVTAKAKD